MKNINKIKERIKEDIKRYYSVAFAFLVYNIIVRKIFNAFCPFLITTGFPCAGCGMTRAVLYILTGRIERGIHLNPTAPIWILLIIWFLGSRYLMGITPKCAKLLLSVAALITFGVYLYRMINFFPDTPPLVFYRNNLISRALSIINGGQ